MLYALANRQLPAAMAKVSRHGVPVAGVAVSIAILLIGSCLNYIIPNPQRVFADVYSASVLPDGAMVCDIDKPAAFSACT